MSEPMYRDAHRLGGATSFHQPPLSTVASLKIAAGVRMHF